MTKICIIGAGQQGTSMAMAFSSAGYDIHAYDNNPKTRDAVRNMTQGHDNLAMHDDLIKAVKDADIIMLATPIDKFAIVLEEINGHVKQGAIVTDIGSAKVKAIKEMEKSLPCGAILIAAHTLTGRAGSGPETAEADMYRGAACVIVPRSYGFEKQQQDIKKLWEDIGVRVVHMPADTHDRLYGAISHLQRMIAISLTACGEDPQNLGAALKDYKQSGNSMLEMTRIAKSSLDMWLPIFRDNREAILDAAHGFQFQMFRLKEKILLGDFVALRELITEAHNYRTAIPENREWESIEGEVYDWSREFNVPKLKGADQHTKLSGTKLSDSFDSKAGSALIRRSLVPTFIAAAATLNLKELDLKYFEDIDLFASITPAFKGGSALMLNNPDYVSALLQCNGDRLIHIIGDFEANLNAFIMAVEIDYEPFISSSIKNVAHIRGDMPKHKAPNELQEEHLLT